jgi:hypothetical protein
VVALVRGRGDKGQGYGLTAYERALVEDRAMQVVTAHFAAQDWNVADVSLISPYDLLCTRGDDERRVEVKGTTGDGSSVLLTRNEVIAACAAPMAAVLAVVHSIALDEGRTRATDGTLFVVTPWRPEDEDLTPIAYRYRVKQDPGT